MPETVYRCKRCHRKIWVLESIIRGMGPICYGKSYSMRRMLKRGLTREEILKIPKEELEQLAKEELKRWKRKQKRSQKKKNIKINMRKIKLKKDDKHQTNLDSFLVITEEKEDIEKLRKQLNEITYSLSCTNGSTQTDKALKLMDRIKELEEK